MKVSVVLTSYNRPNMIREAVDSVVSQTMGDWELIIIDDGSKPEVLKYLTSLAGDKRIEVLLRPPVEPKDRLATCRYAESINIGLDRVKGDYITYLTDDDLYLPTRLDIMTQFLDMKSDVKIVYGRQQILAWDSTWRYVGIRTTVGKTRDIMCKVDHNSFMHRKSCLTMLEKPYWPIDKNIWKDGDTGFFGKLVQFWDFWPIEAVLDVHRIHPNAIQSRMNVGKSPLYSEEL